MLFLEPSNDVAMFSITRDWGNGRERFKGNVTDISVSGCSGNSGNRLECLEGKETDKKYQPWSPFSVLESGTILSCIAYAVSRLLLHLNFKFYKFLAFTPTTGMHVADVLVPVSLVP